MGLRDNIIRNLGLASRKDRAQLAARLNEMILLVNDLRTKYEAHRVLTAGGVHGGADSTNTISAAAVTTTDW
jgi:hypothetical protein